MKYLILILMIFSVNVFADYMSRADILDCNKLDKVAYPKLKTCQKVHADCMQIPESVVKNCEINSEQDTQVDDITKPKFTKNEIEVCSDQADCETKNGVKTCIDIDEQVLMAQDFSEIYCSKPNGFNQMTVKQIRVDATKKAADDALKANELIKTDNRNTNRSQMRGLISSLNAGTDLTAAQRRKLDLLIIRKLIDE